MNQLNRVYHLLHNELERIDNTKIDIQTVGFLDDVTGEFIPIAEGLPQEAENLINNIKKKNSKTFNFVMLWQEAQLFTAKSLSGNSLRILNYFVGNMKFDNSIYGITQRDISSYLEISSRTVVRSVQELQKTGVIIITGKKGSSVYHVNPAYVWKGSYQRIRHKLEMFKEVMTNNDGWKII